MLNRLFRSPTRRVASGRALYARGRRPGARAGLLHRPGRRPTRIEGRFELYTLHVVLLLRPAAAGRASRRREAAQALFDTYVSALDDALREMGVGDLSVGKKMRKLGEAFYGRMTVLRGRRCAAGDAAPLAGAAGAHRLCGRDDAGRRRGPGRLCAGRARGAGGPAARRACWPAPVWPEVTP